MGARIKLLTVPRYNKDDQEALYKYLVAQSLELNRWFNIISFHDHDDTVGTDFSKISNSGIADNAAIATTKLGTGAVVQVVGNTYSSVATGTTTIPGDDTIPQKTEGVDFMDISITPKSETNTLLIDVVIHLQNSYAGGGFNIIAALFAGSGNDAVAASWYPTASASNNSVCLVFKWIMVAGTASALAFQVRAGGNQAGTTTMNGYGGSRYMGGVMASSITITEIAV